MLSLKLRVPQELGLDSLEKAVLGQGLKRPRPLPSTACSAPGGLESESDLVTERRRVTMVQVDPGIRNSRFRLRVWMFDGRFGTILDHFGGSRALSSRGASPPDLPGNL